MCGSMADMDAIQEICRDHKLILLEDACQSIGASYKGKFLGTIGDAGTLSFDFVKTVTCAEGGAVLTNNKKTYTTVMDIPITVMIILEMTVVQNCILSSVITTGFQNYMRQLDSPSSVNWIHFLAIQKKNHQYLQAELAKIPGIKFRTIPDPAGDSHTFLSWFMPSRELTEAVVAEMKSQQIFGGNFYWFEHNWHYIRKWDHLKTEKTLKQT